MGPFWAPIVKFVGAIIFGAAEGASFAYLFAVNVARLAVLTLAAKLVAPKLDLTQTAVEKTLTIRDTIAPQRFIYGEDLVSGPLIFANVGGPQNKELTMIVALAGHEIDSVVSYKIDNTLIPFGDIMGGGPAGVIDSGKFADAARVDIRFGVTPQTVYAQAAIDFPPQFPASSRGDGWATMYWRFDITDDNEDAFTDGTPQNLRALVRGKKVYDPRLDDTNGGVGPHRLADDTTWEWSSNPALCLSDFIRDDKFGMREVDARVDWPLVIIAADKCDETVAIPTASTQTRYTVNATFGAEEPRSQIVDGLVGAMLGRMVFSQGVWKMWAGAAITPDVTLDEANLAGTIQLQASSGAKERYNRVRGKFVDAGRDYTAAAYPEQRSSVFVADDGGEVRELVADFPAANNSFEAQRDAIITLKQSRNQRVVSFAGNFSCMRLQPGTTVFVDVAEYGFAGEKFQITDWRFGQSGVQLTLVEEDDAVWDDPLEGDYTNRTPGGALVFGETGVPAPHTASVTSVEGGVLLAWTNPEAITFTHIEIHASNDNIRGNAVIVGTTPDDSFFEVVPQIQRLRYYWLRAVNKFGQVSDFEPNLTTTTLIAYPIVGQRAINQDPFIRLGASFWDVTDSNASYEVAGGLDGTDAIRIDSDFSFGATARTALRRGPDDWDVLASQGMVIEVRVRTMLNSHAGASWASGVNVRARVTDEDGTSNSTIYFGDGGHLFTDASATGVWFDSVVTILIDEEELETPPRFVQLELNQPKNALGSEFYIDIVDASFAPGIFDPNASAPKSTGLIPSSGLSKSGRVLDDQGLWVAKPGGQTDSDYIFSTTTAAADPGAGIFRFDNATPGSITNIYISSTTDLGHDIDTVLGFLATGMRLYTEQGLNADRSQLFEISGAPVDNTGWWTIPVTAISTSTLPTNNFPQSFIIDFSVGAGGGAAGIVPYGSFNYEFSTTTSMADPGPGIVRLNNATPASVTQIAIDDLDDDGTDLNLTWLAQMKIGDQFNITDPLDFTTRLRYVIVGFNDFAGWRRMQVEHVFGTAIPADTTKIVVNMPLDSALPQGVSLANMDDFLFWDTNQWKASGATMRVNLNTPPTGHGRIETTGTSSAAAATTILKVAVGNTTSGLWYTHNGVPNSAFYSQSKFNFSPDQHCWGWNDNITDFDLFGMTADQEIRFFAAATFLIQEKANAGPDELSYGQFWVRDDAPNVPMFTNDVGTDFELISSVPDPLLLGNGSAGAPTYSFSADTNTGVYGTGNDFLRFAAGGVNSFNVTATQFAGNLANGPVMRFVGASDVIPNFTTLADADTGIGRAAADQLSLIAGGVELMRLTETTTNDVTVRSCGNGLRINDQFNTDYLALYHDGTDSWIDTLNSVNLNIAAGFTKVCSQADSYAQKEVSAAPGDTLGEGQWWVRDDAPCVPMFTNDVGTDFNLIAGLLPTPTVVGSLLVSDGVSTWAEGTTLTYLLNTDITGSGAFGNELQISNSLQDNMGITFQGPTSNAHIYYDESTDELFEQAQNHRLISNVVTVDNTFRVGAVGDQLTIATLAGSAMRILTTTGSGRDIAMLADNGARDLHLTFGTGLLISEKAAAHSQLAGEGQIWVRNDAPNTLIFTDDDGTDWLLNAAPTGIERVDNLLWTATADSVRHYEMGDTSGSSYSMKFGGRLDGTDGDHWVMTPESGAGVYRNAEEFGYNFDNSYWFVEQDLRIVNGNTVADFMTLSHDGTAGLINSSSVLRVDVARFEVRGGAFCRVYNSGNTDFIELKHDGTNAEIEVANTSEIIVSGMGSQKFKINGLLSLEERASAGSNDAGYGQFWVRDDAPCTPMFRDDVGTDFVLSTGGLSAAADEDITGQWDFSNTSGIRILDPTLASFMRLNAASTTVMSTVFSGFTAWSIFSGIQLSLTDAGGSDAIQWQHDGTDLQNNFVNTDEWQITGLNGGMQLRDGAHFRWFGPSDVAFMAIEHDDTDLLQNFSATTDWLITGLSGQVTFDQAIVEISNETPIYAMRDTGSGVDEKLWYMGLTSPDRLIFQTRTDAAGAGQIFMNILRTGTAITEFLFPNADTWEFQDGGTLSVFDSTNAESIDLFTTLTQANIDIAAGSNLNVRNGTESFLFGTANGAVSLYYNGTLKAQTGDNSIEGRLTGWRTTDHALAFKDVGLALSEPNVNPSSFTLGGNEALETTIKNNTTAFTITCEANTGNNFPIGASHPFWNRGASGDITIADGGETLIYLDGSSATDVGANMTCGPGGAGEIYRESATVYLVTGTGLTA